MTNLIIDSNYLCYVNRFAFSKGLSYKGGRTEIIFGFLQHICSLSQKYSTDKIFFCWDSRNSLRKKVYPSYKGTRRPDDRSDEDKDNDSVAFAQFDIIRDKVLPSLGFKNIFMVDGHESDDLIAILVKQIGPKNIVVTNDSDLLQLLDYCNLYNVSKHQLTTKTEFVRNFKITPEQWIEVKAIGGCKSDNISGVPNVAEKTALKYVKGILKEGKYLEAIKSNPRIIRRNRQLVKLPFKELKLTVQENKLSQKMFINVCEEYGFNSLLGSKIPRLFDEGRLR